MGGGGGGGGVGGGWCLSAMDNVCFEGKVSEMYFPTIWRAKFTDLINSEKTQFWGEKRLQTKVHG